MAAEKLKLLIEQGATFRKTLTWKAGTPPVPVNLTGCTARMQMRTYCAEAEKEQGRARHSAGSVMYGGI